MDCCTQTKSCFICNDKVSKKIIHVQCVRCNIYMHNTCYNESKPADIDYTQCKSCNRCGCIGIDVKFLNST